MEKETRRVAAFIVVGLLLAVGVGFGVWRVSSPASPSVTDTATADTNISSDSSTTRAAKSASASQRQDANDDASGDKDEPSSSSGSKKRAHTDKHDPFLAPNAQVYASGPGSGEPTRYYRPDSVGGSDYSDGSGQTGSGNQTGGDVGAGNGSTEIYAEPTPGAGATPAQPGPLTDAPGSAPDPGASTGVTTPAPTSSPAPGTDVPVTTTPGTGTPGTSTPGTTPGQTTKPNTPSPKPTSPTRVSRPDRDPEGGWVPFRGDGGGSADGMPEPTDDGNDGADGTDGGALDGAPIADGNTDGTDSTPLADDTSADSDQATATEGTGVEVPEEPTVDGDQPSEPAPLDKPVTDLSDPMSGDSDAVAASLNTAEPTAG
ncbi:hypothetical protein H0194_08290 [Corynebacterium incognita]|uniref:Uncharacterized protein n=1 Tax=Corynebacterium incognita TaxID=2754725 RepID=A0A7G7CNA5_9CORY|nr:hypothetical protein [Corynebacterium incognita]QNE89071.1 hypothetical protein H0194_08290 [Corynebacterium incognita]